MILEVIYRPFELKIQLKVGILRPKMMPKPLLNNSKTTFKKSKLDPKMALSEGQFLTAKSGYFKAKINAQTPSEHLQNNFQKVQKSTFLDPKMAKSRVPILKKWPKCHPKMSILVVLKFFFEPILHESMGPLSPKTMPKQF